ncbi:MAG TPA: hypothetical protein VJ044_04525 [Candidatus Hodarchaeales archaeon]|nr:hypothetical protein [Candidatus Hodarchaeales archaeon]
MSVWETKRPAVAILVAMTLLVNVWVADFIIREILELTKVKTEG